MKADMAQQFTARTSHLNDVGPDRVRYRVDKGVSPWSASHTATCEAPAGTTEVHTSPTMPPLCGAHARRVRALTRRPAAHAAGYTMRPLSGADCRSGKSLPPVATNFRLSREAL